MREDQTGRFAKNGLGPAHVVITTGDGEVVEHTFEGTFVVAGIEKCPKLDGSLPDEFDPVATAMHSQGTAGGVTLILALLLNTLEEQHKIPPAVAMTQGLLDLKSLRAAITNPRSQSNVTSVDITNGERIPMEPAATDLLRRLRDRLNNNDEGFDA